MPIIKVRISSVVNVVEKNHQRQLRITINVIRAENASPQIYSCQSTRTT